MGKSNLKIILAQMDWTVRMLSQHSGVSYVQCSRLVNGHHKPRIDVAHAIADCLGKHIDEVFPGFYTRKRKSV